MVAQDFNYGVPHDFKSDFLSLREISGVETVFNPRESLDLYESIRPDITDELDIDQPEPIRYLLAGILQGISVVSPDGRTFGVSSFHSTMKLFLDLGRDDIKAILDFLVRNGVITSEDMVHFTLDQEIAAHLARLFGAQAAELG
jgi:hypothetical protein